MFSRRIEWQHGAELQHVPRRAAGVLGRLSSEFRSADIREHTTSLAPLLDQTPLNRSFQWMRGHVSIVAQTT